MAPFALLLQLALASPGPLSLPQQLEPDPGPFHGGELALASAGALVGDVVVLASAYGTLQLFANGSLSPTATNFRRAALTMAGAALLVPPLTSVLLARLAGRPPGVGSAWRALLLASLGQAAALAAGYYAAPRFWVVLPAQLFTVVLGTSVGLHWGGPRRASAAPLPGGGRTQPAVKGEPAAPDDPPASAGLALVPVCPVS